MSSVLQDKRMELGNYPTSFLNIRTELIDSTILNNEIIYSKDKNIDLTTQRYGKFEIVLNGNGYISGIEIEYSGNMRGKIIKPDSWIVFHNNNKIIMFDFGASPIDVIRDYTIFEFSGEMKIRKTIATDYSKIPPKIRAQITKLKGDQFDNTDSIWDNKSEIFESIGVPRHNTRKIINVISDPTYIEGGLFYDENGEKYVGFITINSVGKVKTANKEAGLYNGELYFKNGKEANLKNIGLKTKRRFSKNKTRY